MADLTPKYTPEVKRAADTIRRVVRGLTLTEIVALKECLEDDFPMDPLVSSKPGAGGTTIDLEDGI